MSEPSSPPTSSASNPDAFSVDPEIQVSVLRIQRNEANDRAADWQAAAVTQKQAVQHLGQVVAERDREIAEMKFRIESLEEEKRNSNSKIINHEDDHDHEENRA